MQFRTQITSLIFISLCLCGLLLIVNFNHINHSTKNLFNWESFCASNIKSFSNSTQKYFDNLQPFHYQVSCQKLFENDSAELQYALGVLSHKKPIPLIADKMYKIPKEQCSIYRSERFNESFHLQDTHENQEFPLAFSFLMYNNVEQFERLLRIIYRPQNIYCIHVDTGASSDVFVSVKSIAECFDNVILASKRERVIYATFSRLQADLNCMKDLLKYPSWKYLLNGANTELPLKTNSELVRILSIYNGYNDIEGVWKTRNYERYEYVWEVNETIKGSYTEHLIDTRRRKEKPPGDLEIVKGSAYAAFSRRFVEFVNKKSIAKKLLEWSKDTYSPDEHYWATLNFNRHLHAPGGHKAKSDPVPWTARYVVWVDNRCFGEEVHGICILTCAYLPDLLTRPELFANKFVLTVDPISYQCMEELLINRAKVNLPLINAQFYRQMPFLSES